MIETNIRTVQHGKELFLLATRVELSGQTLSSDQIEKVCGQIARNFRIAAIPFIEEHKQEILINSTDRLPDVEIHVDPWIIKLSNTSLKLRLNFSDINHRQKIANLYKRTLQLEAGKLKELWKIDSPRIFYEKYPFTKNLDSFNFDGSVCDIDAYRRYEIGDVIVDEAGIGVSIEVATAFITNLSVEDYFSSGHQESFLKLSGRQGEQKGTLIYHGPNKKVKCYFNQYRQDLDLGSVPSFTAYGQRFDNAFDYFQKKYPKFEVKSTDKVAYVSFPGMGKPVPVPANRLYLRVMNEMLPTKLNKLDKINPHERKLAIDKFWSLLGNQPFGPNYKNLQKGYYLPSSDNKGIIPLPDIQFGKNKVLKAPDKQEKYHYKQNFKDRKTYLDKFGCYHVPPTMERTIYFVYPERISDVIIGNLSDNVSQNIKRYTGKEIELILIKYNSIASVLKELKEEYEEGMVVFVFNNQDPAEYFNISYELKRWRFKRLTVKELIRKHKCLSDYKDNGYTKGLGEWQSYVTLNTLGILQELGCTPWYFEAKLNYDIQLVIDVSAKGTHFTLSLMVSKPNSKPIFIAETHRKTDQGETINKIFLSKHLKELFERSKSVIQKYQCNTLLVLRDGKDCDEEYVAIQSTINELKINNTLPREFKFDFVEYHKSTQKGIRLWDVTENGVKNVLEGSYALIDENNAILATTGEGTLNQGTAAPLLIVAKYGKLDIRKVIHDIFMTSQLNFSSPTVAQRLTLPAKRADDQLKERQSQEIYRIK